MKSTDIDKWTVMKILQSKGIVSFDEDNYQSMDCRIYQDGFPDPLGKWPTTHIMITFSGYTKEFIPIDEYKTFKRDITIDNILQ